MKKRLILTSFLLCLITAACYDDDINKLAGRIDALENTQIATLKEQVENIENTLPRLEKADKELEGYINNLEETAANLQDELTATEEKIFEVEESLQMSIAELEASLEASDAALRAELIDRLETTQADILARLETAKAEMENELAQINATIELLQAKDDALEAKIAELNEYVNSGIENNKNWAEATFATLDQYNSLVAEIATIKENITAISNSITALDKKFSATIQSEIDKTLEEVNSSIQALDTKYSGVIQTEIENVTKYINEEIAGVTSEITSALGKAVAEAKDEITNEYTLAISSAIENIEASMKSWVNSQLAGYYTIEQADAKLLTVQQELESQMASQKVYLENLISNLSAELNEQISTNGNLIAALQKSIAQLEQTDAEQAKIIASNSGKITKNAEAITSNTQTIRNNATEIESIKASIEALRNELEGDYNEKIKELEEALDKKIAENKKLIEANNLKISANSTAIAENNKAIEALMKSTNEAISNNAKEIAKNAENIVVNAENIAKNAAAIARNATTLDNHAKAIAQNMLDIIELQQALEDTKVEIAFAVASSIETAIETLDGELRGELSIQVATLNTRITNEVATVNSTIDKLTERVTALENELKEIKIVIYNIQTDISEMQEQIAAIINRIQSVTFVPEYSDGKATMLYTNSSGGITAGDATLKYEIRPASVATELASVWETALKAKAVYTKTRAAGDFVSLDIKSATANEGILEVVVSGANFCEEFFRNEISASICLEISSGYNCLTSGYTQIIPWETGAVDIPDANLKAYLTGKYDTNSDGEISLDEAEVVTEINIAASLLQVKSMSGIEYFKNLETLDCSYNKVATLDLASNKKLAYVNVSNNKLTSLVLPASVKTLNAANNELTTIRTSAAKELTTLNVAGNKLASLNLSQNKALTSLNCNDNKLASLDVSAIKQLKTLDVSGNTTLTELNCWNDFDFTTTSLSIDKGVDILDVTGKKICPELGDLIKINGAAGVVFVVSDKNFKIISVEETKASWGPEGIVTDADSRDDGWENVKKLKEKGIFEKFPAFVWCENYGTTDWYLPATNELIMIYNNKSTINSTLQANGYTTISDNYYWSSFEHNNGKGADAVYLKNGEVGYSSSPFRRTTMFVRAILAF